MSPDKSLVHRYYSLQAKHAVLPFPERRRLFCWWPGLFAVQCEAEGHGMVLKLGIKGGERWAGRIQHQLPLLLLLLLLGPRCAEEVMARSESSSADVTCQTYTITVICCCSHPG